MNGIKVGIWTDNLVLCDFSCKSCSLASVSVLVELQILFS